MGVRPGYKWTDVGLIPEDWKGARLSDVCSMKSGDGITSAKIDQFSKYPCYGGNGLRGFTNTFTHDGSYALVGRQGALCGNVLGVEGSFFASEHAIVVTASAGSDIRWLTFVLKQMRLNQYSESSAQPGLSVAKLLKLDLALPPTKTEQEAIARALGDAGAFAESVEQLLNKKRQLKQGALQELLTGKRRLPGFNGEWEVKQLGDLADMGSGGTPLSTNLDFYGGDIPWVSISDMTKCGKTISTTDRSLSSSGLDNSTAQVWPAGTVLYAMYASLGECSIAGVPLCSSQAILGIRVRSRLDNQFLYYYLSSIKAQVKTMGQHGTQANLNKGMVQGFELRLPPSDEQTAIAAILSDMDLEIAALVANHAKASALKQGMMQELLTGRIRLV